MDNKMHELKFTGTLLHPEQGIIIGNGDFCAAVFQRGDEIIWQLGKGDIWDRRIDYHLNPPPADINELRHGLEVERWKCGAYDNEVTALNGTDDPKRMKEICQPTPCVRRPYPMPKPAGELALKLPTAFRNLEINYNLDIEKGILNIICRWSDQAKLSIESFFSPDTDQLAVHYNLECPQAKGILSTSKNEFFLPFASWHFQLRRYADKSYPEFAAANEIAKDFPMCSDVESCETLPPPETIDNKITQKFHAEPTFPEGFEYSLTSFSPDSNIAPLKLAEDQTARINIIARDAFSGTAIVKIKTSLTGDDCIPDNYETLRKRTIQAAEKFWSASSITLEDKFLEQLWYETLHIQRAIFGRGPVSPGLMIPGTIGDYVRWHGDYHSNYNFQSPFWGLAAANHPELLDSYFAGSDYFHIPGKFLAEKYYHCRGAFIQLNAYPIKAQDDWLGCCPMGRMTYMTGWIWHHHWDYYTHTGDLDFLQDRCWPLLKDCALFFIDFMKKGDDGNYHLFPSNCGEDPFTGDASNYRDRRGNLQHAWYTIYIARQAAKLLDDNELIPALDEMLANWPEISAHDNAPEIFCQDSPENPPEFKMLRWINDTIDSPEEMLFPPGHEFWTWYFGHAPMMYLTTMRNGLFKPERDYENFTALLKRWREPNGTLTAMCTTRYGRTGAWTESLGIIGPLQEMLISSWNGIIELFPFWPKNKIAQFENLRTTGAFLVSAKFTPDGLEYVKIHSEKGGICRLKYRNISVEIITEAGENYQVTELIKN
jgi:Glycosyl hydrolase family 95 catalytic domain